MLILTRKEGQELLIGDDIVVTVCEIRSDTVRLGIEAPHRMAILRREVYDRNASHVVSDTTDETI